MTEVRRTFIRAAVMRGLPTLVLVASIPVAWAQVAPAKTDEWAPVRFMVGRWEGTSSGQPGAGEVKRTYEFVLEGRYLHEQNTSTYPPRTPEKPGEVHRHWAFFSYDRARKALVLRQFHQEGFVNQYVMVPSVAASAELVFESESFENLPSGWKARESYRVLSPDAFEETFELAAPGKPFEVYSRARFRRAE